MPKPNKVCIVCKSNYHSCPTCDASKGFKWRQWCCSPECFQKLMATGDEQTIEFIKEELKRK